MAFPTAKLTGTTCSPPSAWVAGSPSRQGTDGWRPSTTTTIASVSSARNATRTWKGKVSTLREGSLSVNLTLKEDSKRLLLLRKLVLFVVEPTYNCICNYLLWSRLPTNIIVLQSLP